jgi:hypothetical protein
LVRKQQAKPTLPPIAEIPYTPRPEYLDALPICMGGTKICPKRERGECHLLITPPD